MAALLVVVLSLGSSIALLASPSAAQDDGDMLLLRTTAGDILAELYPEAAPLTVAQITALVEAGAYDSMPFVRVIDGFVTQAGLVESHLNPPASAEQLALAQNLPLEIDPAFLHTRGVLSMARWAEPDSGTSSFSIVLGDYPHMDGEYTVFGRVIEGMPVADILATIATGENDAPVQAIEIWDAEIGTESELRRVDGFTTLPTADTAEWFAQAEAVPGIATGSTVTTDGGVNSTRSTTPGVVAGLIGALIFGVAAFLLADRLEPRFVGALGLLAALAAAFGLFIALVPTSGGVLAVVFFVCMVGFFRLLSRFESIGAPRPAPDASAASAGTTAAGKDAAPTGDNDVVDDRDDRPVPEPAGAGTGSGTGSAADSA